MYYVAFEEKNTKQKRWKVFRNKQEVFEYFKKIMPKQVPDSNELKELDEVISGVLQNLPLELVKNLKSTTGRRVLNLKGVKSICRSWWRHFNTPL